MPDAALVTHHHTCPDYVGNTPHVGGPILAGGSVKIDGKAAARVDDPCQCNGPMDAIAAGSSSVQIDGKPAARKGDPTKHGGVIVGGYAGVQIG